MTTQTLKHASLEKAQLERTQLLAAIDANPSQFRMISGDRPTGHLHLGHLIGSLQNRLNLAQKGVMFYNVIADYQAFFDRDKPDQLDASIDSLMLDYYALGFLNTNACVFRHSHIPAIHELFLCFLSLFSVAELERNPTIKEEFLSSKQKTFSALFLTYPVHQIADVLCVQGNLVPVGQDQLPHIELIRKAAQRFNERYNINLFQKPNALLSIESKLLGLDGQKMSKSRNNSILISDEPDEIQRKLKKAKTDSRQDITYDPVNRPEISQLLFLLSYFSNDPIDSILQHPWKGAGQLKQTVADTIIDALAPYRQKRTDLLKNNGLSWLRQQLIKGEEKVREESDLLLIKVKQAMNLITST